MTAHLLRSRLLRIDNFHSAAHWLQTDLPLSAKLARELPAVLQVLIEHEAIKGILIEQVAEDGGVSRLCGLGLSVFIKSEAMDAYVARPRCFIFSDILERVQAGEAIVLNSAGIARNNGAGGLELVVNYMQRSWDMSEALWRDVGAVAHQTYVTHHRGYNVRRALQEDWSLNKELYLGGGYRELATIPTSSTLPPAPFKPPGDTRTIFAANASDFGESMPGSTLSYIFQYRPPRCLFTLAEQRVLSHALEWATDQEIADRLGLSLTTVKHAWQSIYQRVHTGVPHIIGSVDDEGRRGPEKRRRVLSFVEEHPEELRPYAKPKR